MFPVAHFKEIIVKYVLQGNFLIKLLLLADTNVFKHYYSYVHWVLTHSMPAKALRLVVETLKNKTFNNNL